MSESSQTSTSRVARIAAALVVAALGTAVIGILGVQVGVLSPVAGFYLFALGALLGGLLSLVLGGISLFLTNGGRDPLGYRRAWIAAGGGALMLGVVVMAGSAGSGVPAINDITTNLDDPPGFTQAPKAAPNQGRDMSYPGDFVVIVRESYPDLAPLRVDQSTSDAYQTALSAAQRLGWTITYEDPTAGFFEAEEVSAVFRFVDDIAVRVRADGSAALVDIRSKSRDGRGDMGVNAARIRAFGNIVAPGNVASR